MLEQSLFVESIDGRIKNLRGIDLSVICMKKYGKHFFEMCMGGNPFTVMVSFAWRPTTKRHDQNQSSK